MPMSSPLLEVESTVGSIEERITELMVHMTLAEKDHSLPRRFKVCRGRYSQAWYSGVLDVGWTAWRSPRDLPRQLGPRRYRRGSLHLSTDGDSPGSDLESRRRLSLWNGSWRGGTAPWQGRHLGTRHQHCPDAALRAQFRILWRRPAPNRSAWSRRKFRESKVSTSRPA